MLFWFLTEGLSQLYKHSVDWNCNNSQQMAFPRGWLRLKGESPHFKFSAPCELTGLWVGGNDYLRLSSAENFALQQGWRDVGQGIKASTLGTERATVGWGVYLNTDQLVHPMVTWFSFLFNLFRYVIAYYVKLTTKPLNLFSYKNLPRPLTCIFNKGYCSPMKEQPPIPELITKVQLLFK